MRLTEEEHQKLLRDSEGFRSLSEYIRTFLKSYPALKSSQKVKGHPGGSKIFYQGKKHNSPDMRLSKMLHDDEAENEPDNPTEDDIQIPVKNLTKIGRNAPCPCGSGKKYKKCCMNKEAGRFTGYV
jgi:preprotein translocase subunit SecA